MDFLFLEFYIQKKYNQKVEDYFGVNKVSVSHWRSADKIPPQRQIDFLTKEGSLDPKELFLKIYPET